MPPTDAPVGDGSLVDPGQLGSRERRHRSSKGSWCIPVVVPPTLVKWNHGTASCAYATKFSLPCRDDPEVTAAHDERAKSRVETRSPGGELGSSAPWNSSSLMPLEDPSAGSCQTTSLYGLTDG